MIAFMIVVFGAIPFTDAMIVRYVDDRMRSRVCGMRLAVSFSVSSLAVWPLGPVVKAAGFGMLLLAMAAIALLTLCAVAVAAAARRAGAYSGARRGERLAQSVENARRRGDHFVGAQEIGAAGEIADAAARFLDQQRTGGNVPGLQGHRPEPSSRPAAT